MGALRFLETFVSLLFCCSILTSDLTLCDDPSDVTDFVESITHECHFTNGTQKIQYLERYIYNQEEYAYFDSDYGYFRGKDDFGQKNAENWNKNKEILDQKRSYVERCKYNYGVAETSGVIGRKVEPSIKISMMEQSEHSHTKLHVLGCNVFGFFPSEIEVKWYRNGQEETAQVQFTEPHHNGDWSFQMLVMLETEIQKGDTFTCEVHHSSLKTPHRVHWHPQSSDSAKNKMATGIVGFVLGAAFIIVGLVIYLRAGKGQHLFRVQQSESFLPQ